MPVSPNVRARGKRGKYKAAGAATKPAAAARTSPEPSRINLYDEVTVRIMIRDGRFPKPYKITAAAARWSEREVDAWIEGLTRGN